MTIQTFTAGQTLTATQMNTLQASDFNFTRDVQTGTSYTLVETDKGKLLEFSNAGSINLTIPTNASVPFEIGDRVDVLLTATGSLVIAGASGVTVNAEGGITTISSQWTRVTLIKRATNDWVITGGSGEIQTTEIEDGAITSAKILDGTIMNVDINASAAIALSKLANATAGQVLLGTTTTGVVTATTVSGDVTITGAGVTAIGSGVIMDADVNASAAIALSKLANATAGQVLLGTTTTGVVTATTVSGDVTITGAGVTAIGSGVIVDADVNASAAIALSKLATGALPTAITVASANIVDGTIVNTDVNASAAIDKTKISGTAITAADTGTVTSTMIADGTIVNADIDASAAIVDTKLATISTALKVSNSATTAASANTASAIVARDASGNFIAGKATLATADINTVIETASIVAAASTGTINIDFSTNPTVYYTVSATANWTLNVRGTSGVTLNDTLSTGQIATVTFLATNGATAYRPTVFQVDGVSVTPKWMGGTAPSTGNTSSIDAYTLSIIKTGSAAFTVLASQTKFA